METLETLGTLEGENMGEWHECSNCEGEGRVTRWGLYGHEVPASRPVRYPKDAPLVPGKRDGEARPCGVCGGSGGYDYASSFPCPYGEAAP